MKQVPVKGGQLRLVKAVDVTVPGDDGPRQVRQIAFPLKHTAVQVQVAGMMAHVAVTQTFENPFKTPLEAVYLFPLGDGSAVSGYEIVIGERVIKGQIKTRDQAQKIYRRARARGHTAALLQQEKANVFSQRIANIAPGERIQVRLRYVELLRYRDHRYELVFPMVVGPRYLPRANPGRRPVGSHHAGGPATPGVASIPYVGSAAPGMPKIDITVRLDAGVPLGAVKSPSHRVTVKKVDATTARVTLAAVDRVPNRDFILRYAPRAPTTMVGLLTHRADQDGYFVLMVQPKAAYRTGDITPREVLILIDVSGSMNGPPLAQAKAVAKGVIARLGPRDSFNVMSFADGTRSMRRRAVAATAASKAAGRRWVDHLRTGGGTELERAVVRSLQRRPGADRIRMVYLLTDGYVGNDKVILATARRHLGHNRVFPVGVGSAPNRFLLNRLAEVGRGFPSYISLRESPAKVLVELARRTTYPYLTDVKIAWGGLAVHDLVPQRIPDVYAGMPLMIAGRYRKAGRGTVVVTARTAGRAVAVKLPVTLPAAKRQGAVAHLWARQRINELVSMNYTEVRAATKKEITRLGLRFGLVTDYTSYVAVDRSRVVSRDGAYRTVVQPAPVPEGVNLATAVQGPVPSPSGGYGGGGGTYAGGPSGGGRYGGADLGLGSPWLPLVLLLGWIPLILLRVRRRRGRPRGEQS
jgi:Ca-activated chloride channel family protein